MSGIQGVLGQIPAELKLPADRCRALLLSDTAYANEQSYRMTYNIVYNTDAVGYFKSLTPEGSWSDIDYAAKDGTDWQPCWHLYRALLLCREYHKNGSPEYLDAIHRTLAYWIKNDFRSNNWWQNQINIPFCYSSLLMMLDKNAVASEVAFLEDVLAKRIKQNNPTGQNKIWQHDIEARVALLHNDIEQFRRAVDNLKSLVKIGIEEGVQPDYSYHQHGAMLQFGNYGFHYVNSLLFWMTVTKGSKFAFEPDKEKILFDYCTNGLRWTIYQKSMDVLALGRQLRPNCGLIRGAYLHDNFNIIKSSFPAEPCLFTVSGFQTAATASCSLTGNKSFWRSDYMVHRKADQYMISLKMHGNYVKKVESINGENLRGAFLNDGVCLVQRSGLEHHNIAPLWNWTMLPGITCDTTLDVSDPKIMKASNVSNFVGQLSDGQAGFGAMYYQRDSVSASKSYFFIGDMVVALGAGVLAPDMKKIVTTVNQRYSAQQKPVVQTTRGATQWIWHDSIAYFFPGNQDIYCKTSLATGDWEHVDKWKGSKPVQDELVTISISHAKNNAYVYLIGPGLSYSDAKKMAKKLPIRVVSNTETVQAVQSEAKTMAVFYKPAALQIPGSQRLIVSQPCLVLVTNQGDKAIWVSDPTRQLSKGSLQLGAEVINFDFPAGDNAGASVRIR